MDLPARDCGASHKCINLEKNNFHCQQTAGPAEISSCWSSTSGKWLLHLAYRLIFNHLLRFIYTFTLNLICSRVSSRRGWTLVFAVFDELYACRLIYSCMNKSLCWNAHCLYNESHWNSVCWTSFHLVEKIFFYFFFMFLKLNHVAYWRHSAVHFLYSDVTRCFTTLVR